MGLGLVQVYSTSALYSQETLGRFEHYAARQLQFVVLAVLIIWMISQLKISLIKQWGWMLWILGAVGVALTFVPGLGVTVGGATRWLQVTTSQRLEPSEFLRVGLILWLATFFSFRGSMLEKWPWWLLLVLSVLPLGLLVKQPDFGSFVIILSVAVVVLFAFGLQRRVLVALGLVLIPMFVFLITQAAYRMNRIQAFLDPWKDPEQKGFQVIQSMLSFSNGGFLGAGLGASQGKLYFLPEAHTDFTLAVFGEEWGFWGFAGLMALYGFLCYRGFLIAVQAKDSFEKVLALGLTVLFSFSFLINVGVVLGVLPTKGLTLPFLSYGGSSLLATAILWGLLLAVERNASLRNAP